MKKLFLASMILLSISYCFGQTKAIKDMKTLKVTYSEKANLGDKLKSITDPMMKDLVAKKLGQEKFFDLHVLNGESIYKKGKEANQLEADDKVTVIGNNNQDIIYKNHNDGKLIKQINFMSRVFLVDSNMEKIKWNISDESMKIGEYNCKKATTLINEIEHIAWFTSDVPVNEGPEVYSGLPGLIIKMVTDSKIMAAIDVAFVEEEVKINPPTKGKKVTLEEFDAIKKQKLKELTGQEVGGGGVQIINMK